MGVARSIGTGNISSQWVRSLEQVEGATVSAVAARTEERAREFADAHGIATAYGSYGEMVESADVDVVYVGTITRLHKEHSLLAIAAGKHVLCEKPLAGNAADAREMYAAAEARGVMLQDAMWTRFFPRRGSGTCCSQIVTRWSGAWARKAYPSWMEVTSTCSKEDQNLAVRSRSLQSIVMATIRGISRCGGEGEPGYLDAL